MLVKENVSYYIGENLRRVRLLRGMSQKEVAKKLETTYQQIQKYEQGKNKLNVKQLTEFSEMFNVSIASFFDYEDIQQNKTIEKRQLELLHHYQKLSPHLQQSFFCLIKEITKH